MKIIHLSDLHFGTERPALLNVLLDDIQRMNADVVVISGDLTQRALTSQFESARNFVDMLQKPTIIIPGNHDISLYNPIERFFYPYHKFRKYLCDDLSPTYQQNNNLILGINSVTPYKPMGGYLTQKQLAQVATFFKARPSNEIRIITMHHNLIRSERHKNINHAETIIERFAKSNVNLVLSGHIHSPHVEHLKRSYLSKNMYIVTAGTAISDRTIAPNSYNVLEIDKLEFKLTIHEFRNNKFEIQTEKIYFF